MIEHNDAESTTRRCYLCKRELPLASFRIIASRQTRGAKVYAYKGPSSDCRECNREYKREQRRRKAEREGRSFEARGDRAAWDAAQADRRAARKLARSAAWAICLAFRALVRLSAEGKLARTVARQRERYNTEPDYHAQVKAKKIRRTRAQRGTQVVPVHREQVADRDRWRCGICGGEVTRETWSLDHIVPLSRGGSHTYENVQLAHRSCNSRKGNRAYGATPCR